MTTIGNPSADKFGPPPAPKDPLARKPLYRRWWFAGGVALAFLAGKLWLNSHRRGPLGIVAGLGVVALYCVDYYVWHLRHAESGGDDPYTPPTSLTR